MRDGEEYNRNKLAILTKLLYQRVFNSKYVGQSALIVNVCGERFEYAHFVIISVCTKCIFYWAGSAKNCANSKQFRNCNREIERIESENVIISAVCGDFLVMY